MDYAQKNTNQITRRCGSIWRSPLQKANRFAAFPSINQSGSALIVGISLLPIVVGALLSTFAVVWFISAKNDLLYNCENGVLKSQKILVEAENSLLKLNLPIRSLVTQKKILQRALLLARTPIEISMIKARLLIIESQLAVLRKQQIAIHTMANVQASRYQQLTALRLKQTFHHLQNLWTANLFASGFASPALVKLQKVTIDTSAHVYEAQTDFVNQQTLTVFGKLSGRSLFPEWLAFLHEKSFSWQESCSSRPHLKENNTWTAEIGKGKSSSKLL